MASSGSFSGSIRSGHYTVRVDWTQAKNVSANTSTITCKIYLVNDWSLSISGRTDNTITIDGGGSELLLPGHWKYRNPSAGHRLEKCEPWERW